MIYIVEAYCDEHGKAIGGNAGDQTGREIRRSVWRNFGQEFVLRLRDSEKAKLLAKKADILCDGNWVGYNQSDRTGLYNELKKVHWNCGKLKIRCNTDCSALAAALINAVGIEIPAGAYSGNIVNLCQKTGKFDALSAKDYTTVPNLLQAGDILVRPGHHVAIVSAKN